MENIKQNEEALCHGINRWEDCKISNLKTGDLVRHKSGGVTYVVTANYGNRVTAVATADVSNEIEWSHLTNCQQ